MIILRKVLKVKLLAVFVGIMALTIMGVGYRPQGALLLLQECLRPKLDKATRDHRMHVLEALNKPFQKDDSLIK
jgi:hypothetical protein